MRINDKDFDFNATSLEGIKKQEEATEKRKPIMEEAQNLMKEGKLYEGSKMLIEAVRAFFLELAGIDIVGDCDDVVLATAFLEDFNKQVGEQRDKVRELYFKRR